MGGPMATVPQPSQHHHDSGAAPRVAPSQRQAWRHGSGRRIGLPWPLQRPTSARHAERTPTMTQAATETTTPAASTEQQTDPAAGATAAEVGQQAAAVGAAAAAAGTSTEQTQATTPAGDDDDLTDDERAGLSEAGQRALDRMREARNTARTELETTRTQLQQALERINSSGDGDEQVQTLTTERDTAQQSLRQLNAALRNGLATPRQGETAAQTAARVEQVAGLLQGADDAALDKSAQVLLSLAGPGTTTRPPTTGDTEAGRPGDDHGELSMNDRIRQAAGRGRR